MKVVQIAQVYCQECFRPVDMVRDGEFLLLKHDTETPCSQAGTSARATVASMVLSHHEADA